MDQPQIAIARLASSRDVGRTNPNVRAEVRMPELLQEGLPERQSRSKFDFSQWADGQAWKFVKGEDYDSSTESFRVNVKRWAKEHGYQVELRPYPAVDRDGKDIPVTKADPVALSIVLHRNGDEPDDAISAPSPGAPR
jgi:hypothetical protein